MRKKPLATSEEEDIDALIDRAVDTFFVEAPSFEEYPESAPSTAVSVEPVAVEESDHTRASNGEPSFDEAMENLFTSGFSRVSHITSGDEDTDKAIDLAVDTLFIEEPDSAPPETAQLEVKVAEAPAMELFETPAPSSRPVVPQRSATPTPRSAPPAAAPLATKPDAGVSVDVISDVDTSDISYDDAMAREIERHMHTLYQPKTAVAPNDTKRPQAGPAQPSAASSANIYPLRKLQEAILTLEWEISRRSITVVASELHKVRSAHSENVTVDFAALAMRVVLEYLAKRMSKAHPESVRFLLEVTDFLDRSMETSETDPLKAFHHILTRYERYKSLVRRAEGLPDAAPAILGQLGIADTHAFSATLEKQAKTLIRAGRALVSRLHKTNDPENLIRSFRFLVNRSVNKVLDGTQKDKGKKSLKTQKKRKP